MARGHLIIIVLLLAPAAAHAQSDAPDTGLLYNTKETHSLTYQCARPSDGAMECEFIQTAVRKKATARDLDSLAKRARDEYREAKFTEDECRTYSEVLGVLEGRVKPPKEPSRPISAMETKDYASLTRAMVAFCKSRTEANYLAILRIAHDRDSRTCTISSLSYKQRFRPVRDGREPTPAWVVAQDGPSGPCGIVNLSRFEIDKETVGRYPLWRYTARKAVTNPQGTLLLGGSCNRLDEDSYLYDWKSAADHPLGCDYISFSPL